MDVLAGFVTLYDSSCHSIPLTMDDSAALYVVASPDEVDTLAQTFGFVSGQGDRLYSGLREVDYQQHFVVLATRWRTGGSSRMITLRRMGRRGTHVQMLQFGSRFVLVA